MSKQQVPKQIRPEPTNEQRDARKLRKVKVEVKYEEVQPFTQKDFDDFIDFCYSDNPEWSECYKKPNITVWKMKPQKKSKEESSVRTIRVKAIYPDIDAATLYDVLHDHQYRETWDENMLDGYPIEILNKTNEVGYYSAKMPKGITNRDFCNKRGWVRRKKDKIWVIMNSSVLHPGCPEYKGFIRGWSFQTGYLIKEKKKGKGVEFIYCSRSDPKGWIPTWAVNFATTKFAPKLVERFRTAVKSYEVWKKACDKREHLYWHDDKEDDPEKKWSKEKVKESGFRANEVYFYKGSGVVEEDDQDIAEEEKKRVEEEGEEEAEKQVEEKEKKHKKKGKK